MNNHKAGILTVLRNRDFLALWLSQLVSKIGDNFAVLAALVMINDLADRPGSATVLIAAAMTIPQLLALVSGVLVDRFSRKAVMVISDLLRAAVVLLALLVHTKEDLYLLYLAAFAVNAFGAMFIPARNAEIPNLVPEDHLLTANALIQATELVSLILGAMLATLIISLFSVTAAFFFDSATFLVSALLLLLVRIPWRAQKKVQEPTKGRLPQFRAFWGEFADGLSYIRQNNHLLHLMAITTMATLGLSATVLLSAAFFEEMVGKGAQNIGWLQAGEGIGMALGAILISAFASWARSRQIVSITMLILGGGILIFALAPSFWLVLGGAVIVGLAVVSARTTLAAMTQALVPDSQRGRVESAMVTVIGLGSMGSLVIAGILGDIVGPTAVFALTGFVVLVAGVASIFSLREAERRLLALDG